MHWRFTGDHEHATDHKSAIISNILNSIKSNFSGFAFPLSHFRWMCGAPVRWTTTTTRPILNNKTKLLVRRMQVSKSVAAAATKDDIIVVVIPNVDCPLRRQLLSSTYHLNERRACVSECGWLAVCWDDCATRANDRMRQTTRCALFSAVNESKRIRNVEYFVDIDTGCMRDKYEKLHNT